MIYCDIDAVLIDFYGTAKKFDIELAVNDFGKWSWDKVPPEEFYAKAELQPWALKLLDYFGENGAEFMLLTHDYSLIKAACLRRTGKLVCNIIEAPDKSVHCHHPWDTLIDDNIENILAWRRKGGVAFWFNLEWENPFEKFLEWARLK
jgi:hypothetical protein